MKKLAIYVVFRPRRKALEAINEAEALAERFEQRVLSARLHRLRGVFLAQDLLTCLPKKGPHPSDQQLLEQFEQIPADTEP